MKFQVGDKVTVLHSNEEAEVDEIINDKMVMVQVRGVKFPAYIDQLDFPYFKRFTEQRKIPQKKDRKYIDQLPVDKTKQVSNTDEGVGLTFIPVSHPDEFGDEVVDTLKIHLVNRSPVHYHFHYRLLYSGKENFELKNDLMPSQDFYLHDIPFENLNDSPSFDVEFSLVKPDKKKADFYERSLKLKPKQVFLRIEEIRKKGDASFSYKILDQYPDKVETVPDAPPDHLASLKKAGYKIYEASQTRRHLDPPQYEVDLHIEKLATEWRQLSNFEIMTIQLRAFEKYLDLAIAHHQHNLIVIHGVGTGKLRDEIHEILKTRREIKSFVNQYDPRYGYGATEIFL